MLEVTVTICLLGGAFVMYSESVISLSRARASDHETALASDAAQHVIETMRSEDFRLLYSRYNQDPFDDPAGTGTAPGNRFEVHGLAPLASSPDVPPGRIDLPAVQLGPRVWEMHENEARPDLGLPRDLNGDSIIDGADHAGDYIHLPLRVSIDWQGRFGRRHFELDTMLVEFHR